MKTNITVRCDLVEYTSFSIQQDAYPIVRGLTLTNNSENELQGAVISIRFSPAFAEDFTACAGNLVPGIPCEISPVNIGLFPEYLSSLTETVTASADITVSVNGEDIFKETRTIKLLPNDKTVTRQTLWERKLLDLSLRNSLLNFRPGSSSVQLMTTGLGELEDELSKSESLRILPIPEGISAKENELKIYEAENSGDKDGSSSLKTKSIHTYLSETELEKVLKKIHRQAKVSIEENGANTLYLALGFLRWYETEKEEKARIAPLILVPVELTRRILDKSFSVRIRNEDPQINVTLLELLRQDYGINITGLDEIPEDENGINTNIIFDIIKQGVSSMKNWEIIEAAFIGQFSFSRFIMWNDIRSRCEDLRKNKVVASLISGKMEWEAKDISLPAAKADETLLPSDLAIPSSADSSQLSAIYQASQGESFVLHGPPGSGKSQTITNMIANALYHKKTVLFVAEKMAALSVVQKRLEKIGLDAFCLELHSNKAQKRAVLSQLEKTLDTVKSKSSEEYRRTADKLLEKRKELNGTMSALHTKQEHGFSLSELITMFEQNIEYKGKLNLPAELLSDMNGESLDNWVNAVRELVFSGNEAGGINTAPFRYCKMKQYTSELRDLFAEAAKALYDTAIKSKAAYEAAFAAEPTGIAVIRACVEAINAAKGIEYIMPLTAESPDLSVRKDALEKLIADGCSLTKLSEELNGEFDAAVADWNASEALLKWRAAEQKWALPKSLEQGKLLKEMALYRKGGKPTNEQFISGCERLIEKKRLADSITSAESSLTAFFGALWSGASTDFEKLGRCFAENVTLNEALRPIRGTEQLKRIISGENGGATAEFISAYTSYQNAENTLKTAYLIDFTGVYGEAPCCFDAAAAEASRWLENIDILREHCGLNTAKENMNKLGLSFITEALEKGDISPDEAEPALLCAFSYAAANRIISADESLSSFRGARFEESISRYRELCSEFEKLTIKELTAELSSRIPDSSFGAGSSELGILLKAIKSGGRMMSIRKLFDSIPTLLRRICPVMLMSPISVAQYIDPSFPKFDLVIFDEASQLPTSEAVGAIARGENAVIVGDPKQLPPTSFFMAEHTDEENADIDDLESVLDDCLALAMPQKHLLWHYRSRHESLIAYSNAKYYDNSLLTFPSPDDLVSRVRHIPVEGYYDKGGSKQNRAEAEAVVGEIVRRLSDEELRKESIGVVTFSLVQQILIDDLLSEEFRKNPELEQIADNMYETILIKNLENVQGDERDVILFSIGYGPDKDGNVSMNFGPLNRDGGWRRLNVAITRARKSMLVFSVITADQIDMNRTSSDGVAGLKGFLEFAQRGSTVLPVRKRTAAEGNALADIIADNISAMGYGVKRNIGCSEYKIDIGVVNPDEPDTYLLGIVFDGKRSLETGSARDRYIGQPGVLKGLGWRIMNIWSMDVYDSKEKVLANVKEAIEKAISENRNPPEPEKTEPVEAPEPKLEEKPAEKAAEPVPEAMDAISGTIPFTPFNVPQAGTPDDFYSPEALPKIKAICHKIIAAEAPISKESLFRKSAEAFGITRMIPKTEKQIEAAISDLGLLETSSDSGSFLWGGDMSPINYGLCRVPVNDEEKRALEDICPQEIANGVKIILENQMSMSRADLIRETAKLFGFTRLGNAIEAAAAEGIDAALRKGYAKEDNDRIGIAEG